MKHCSEVKATRSQVFRELRTIFIGENEIEWLREAELSPERSMILQTRHSTFPFTVDLFIELHFDSDGSLDRYKLHYLNGGI